MNVTVVHNASAGHTDIGPEQLSRVITRAGHTPTFCEVDSTACSDRLRQRDGEQDLVVVAGGDGSVRSVGQALLHRVCR